MKKKFRAIIEDLGHKTQVRKELVADVEKLSSRLAVYHINLETTSLKRLIGYFNGKEKPSLDRLALFAGFQNWKDLSKALHGDNDAKLNYED